MKIAQEQQQQQQLVHGLGLKRAFRSRGGQEKEKIKSTHPIVEITHSPCAGFSLGFAIAIRRRGEIKTRPQK